MITPSPEFDQEHERLIRAVFNAMSHDLKTPLACIIGSLEIMERMKEVLTPENRDVLLQTAITESHKLDSMLSEMLEKFKPE